MPMRVKEEQAATQRSAPGRRFPSTPEEVLSYLPIGTKNWKAVLVALLRLHNAKHSAKDKGVSLKTMEDRRRFYMGFFTELRKETRFKIEPRQLRGLHVEVMVQRWVERSLAPATLHNYLSFLRTFAEWLGKAGMVREPAFYVGSDSPLAHRIQVPSEDKSWSAKGIDSAEVIKKVAAIDQWVGLQLELCQVFAMRPKEARHFRPHDAERTRVQAIRADAAAHPEADLFIRIEHGTKGGRARDVPVVTDAQRQLLDRLKQTVPPGGYVGRPDRTSRQNQHRFYYVVRRSGISKKDLGIVAHGLRHEVANDSYEEFSGAASPVRGGDVPPHVMADARYRVARLLGHARERAAAFYIGSPNSVRAGKRKGNEGGGNDEGGTPCSPA